MNTSRLPVALGVIGAFVAGIFVGTFLESGPSPADHAGVHQPLASTDSPAAVTHASAPTPGKERLRNAKEDNLTGEELAARVWSALTLGDDNERHAEWLRLLPRLTAGDAVAIRELFRKMEAQGRHFDFEWTSFWLRWGEIEGAAALEYLASNENENFRPTAAEMILKGWAKENPGAARTWLAANAASPLYESALRGYVDGLARNDLARATTEALALGTGRDMSGIMEVLADQALQQRQVNGMLDWWRALPDDPSEGSARKAAIEHIYSRLQLADVDRAQSLITELAGTPYRSDERLGEVAATIAQKDPARAVAWVASLPPSTLDEGHYIAIGRTIRTWGAQDAPATEAWINGLQPSPLRDQALVAYSEYLRRAQLPGSEQWLAQVQDQTYLQRRTTSQTIIYDGTTMRIQGGNLNPANTFILEAPVPVARPQRVTP